MPETKKLFVGRETRTLWYLLDQGWSVVKAIYNTKKCRFTINLVKQDWPEITIPCSTCGTRFPPVSLFFKPHPSRVCTCVTCT